MCHRSVGLVQNAIEHEGIPTVSVTVRPEITCALRVPRAGYVRFPTGQIFGEPNESWQHELVLAATLRLFDELHEPAIVELPFRWRRWSKFR